MTEETIQALLAYIDARIAQMSGIYNYKHAAAPSGKAKECYDHLMCIFRKSDS